MNLKFIKDILNWISGAAKKVKDALTFGKDFANKAKEIADLTIWDLVVKATPWPVDDALLAGGRMILGQWVERMGWAEKKLSDFDETTLPHVINAINAESAKLYADSKGIDLSRQQAIASAQVVYNPDIVKV